MTSTVPAPRLARPTYRAARQRARRPRLPPAARPPRPAHRPHRDRAARPPAPGGRRPGRTPPPPPAPGLRPACSGACRAPSSPGACQAPSSSGACQAPSCSGACQAPLLLLLRGMPGARPPGGLPGPLLLRGIPGLRLLPGGPCLRLLGLPVPSRPPRPCFRSGHAGRRREPVLPQESPAACGDRVVGQEPPGEPVQRTEEPLEADPDDRVLLPAAGHDAVVEEGERPPDDRILQPGHPARKGGDVDHALPSLLRALLRAAGRTGR